MVEQQEIIYESCSEHTDVQEDCSSCIVDTAVETMLNGHESDDIYVCFNWIFGGRNF